MTVHYLSVEDVLLINAEVLAGAARLRERNLLESAVARPQASAFGQDAYPTPIEKAAALMHSLTLNHPFVDGNKRTAIVAVILMLQRNGYKPTWRTLDAYHFIIAVAEGKHDVPAIAAWLTTHTAPLTS